MNTQKWDLSRSEAKLAQLAQLVKKAGSESVLILSHNSPDPDTIGCAFGMAFLLKKKFGVRSALGYGGIITRAENNAMIRRLKIPIKRLSTIRPAKYYGVALVDAQPGTGQTLLERRGDLPMIVVDHHPLRKLSLKAPFHDIRSNYGATSTIVTEYILAAGLTPLRSVATALLYGIKSDTHSLLRGAQEVDFDAFNYLLPLTNPRVLGWIEKPSLCADYFADYHRGLSQTALYKDTAVSYLATLCHESIIPELADAMLRIEGVVWSLCMGEVGDNLVLSMRSSARNARAGNLIRRLVGRAGFAGGHKEMAGGQVPLSGMTKTEKRERAQKLVDRFVTLIGRDRNPPKWLVHQSPAGDRWVCNSKVTGEDPDS